MVARAHPELRRIYMPFPWAHFYEHPYSIATVNVERQWNDENVVFHAQIRRPEARSLTDLDTTIRYLKDEDVEKVGHFRRIMRMTKVPWPLRKLVWWCALNLFSRAARAQFRHLRHQHHGGPGGAASCGWCRC